MFLEAHSYNFTKKTPLIIKVLSFAFDGIALAHITPHEAKLF